MLGHYGKDWSGNYSISYYDLSWQLLLLAANKLQAKEYVCVHFFISRYFKAVKVKLFFVTTTCSRNFAGVFEGYDPSH